MMVQSILNLLVAAICLVAATTPAQADPVSILILGYLGIAATSTAVAITTFALGLAASIGLSYLAKALSPKPSQPDISSLPGGTTGKMQTGGIVPRSFLVGRTMTAGSLVYPNTYSPAAASDAAGVLGSSTYAAGNTPNAYLVQVIALSDLPVSGLVGMFVGSEAATYNSATPPSLEGIPIPEFNKDGKDYLWVRFYDGTQIAADAQLVEIFGADADRPYTSARIGTGIAYAVVTALVNQDLFPSFPQCKFVLGGIKLYDRRYDSTAGGSGSQRWATPSTWALTGNPIVIAENILRGISYGGTWLYGAQTVAVAQLPAASWMAAASECDALIGLGAGGTEIQFYVGGEIRLDAEPAATLEELLKACNGRMAEIGGTYKVRAGAAGAAVFSFTDGDILSTEQQTFEPFPSLGQTINAIKAKYISPAEGWVAKDAPPLYDTALETADGGRRLPVDINYSFVSSGTMVQRLMKAARDSHRAMRTHALPLPPDAFVLEPLDVISWTSTRNGYVNKLFDIETADDLPNLNMGLALREIDPNAYDWDAGTDEQPVTDGTIVLLRPPPQAIVDWSAVPWVVTSDGIQSLPGIKLGWDPASDDVNGIALEIRRAADGVIVYSNSFADADLYARGSIIVSQGLVFKTAYEARGRYLPISNRATSWSAWLGVTTPDVRATIAALDDALNRHITTQLADAAALLRETQNLVASLAAEQDAANAIDKMGSRSVMSAQFGSAYAAIISESALRVSADAALAVSISSVSAVVNDVSAGTMFRAVASAGTGGALALIDLQVSAAVGAVFASAGIQIAAYVNELGVPYSRLRFYADRTEIGIPGVVGGDFFAPFLVDYVNGVPQISLRSDAIPDGAIGTRGLAAGVLGTIAVANSADVTKTYTQWNNSGAGETVILATLNTTPGNSIFIEFDTLFDASGAGGAPTGGFLKLKVNGSVIKDYDHVPYISTGPTISAVPNHINAVVNNLPGGVTSVEVVLFIGVTSSNTVTAVAPALVIREMAKPTVVDISTTITTSVSYRTSLVGGSDGTSGLFSAVDIGSADPYRVVVVAVGWKDAVNAPTMTIGGVAATRHAFIQDWFGQQSVMALFAARYPTGTTADIVVSIAGSPKDINIHVWKVVALSASPSRAGGGYTYDGSIYTLGELDITNAVAGEVVLSAVYGAYDDATYSASWSGSDAVTERADAATGTTQNRRYGAYDLTRTQAGDKTLSITQSNAGYPIVAVIGRWK